MKIIINNQYDNFTLLAVIEKVEKEYYDSINYLCENAEIQTDKLCILELQQPTSQYILLCNNLIEEIVQFIAARKQHYIPYIKQLSEKTNANHDCSNCAGNCKISHGVAVLEIKDTVYNLKGILNRVQMASLPLYSETKYPGAYRVLRNYMALIENSLTDLFIFEENYLIPKITEAQKSINAGS